MPENEVTSRSVCVAGKLQTLYLVDGEWMTQAEAAHLLGITKAGLLKRLQRGWDIQKALSTPGQPKAEFRLPPRQALMREPKRAAYNRLVREGRWKPFAKLWGFYRRAEHGLNQHEAFYEALRLFPETNALTPKPPKPASSEPD